MSIKERIKNGEKLFGTHMMMGNYWVADMFGMAGLDFVWIDTEHTCIDYQELLQCITILKAHGTAVFVRTQKDDYNHTKRLLEMGIDGIIFPMVETAEQAEECMKYTFYPPRGVRGFGPMGAVGYGFKDTAEYVNSEDELCRFVQIESVETVKNLEKILENPAIDGFIFGPCDMAFSAGYKTDVWNPDSIKAFDEAIKTLKAHGKYIGVSIGGCNREMQKKWFDLGVDMVSDGSDYGYIFDGLTKNVKQLSEIVGKKSNKK